VKKFVAISFDVADAGILAGGTAPGTALHLLSPDRPALVQIADALTAAGHLFDEVHIVAHGRPGTLYLDGDALCAETLGGHADSFTRIADGMTADGVIALTACQIADGAAGQELLAALSAATGRRVTGTDREVGAGDAASFAFAATGSPASPFNASARLAYAATLAPPVFLFPAVELSDVEAGLGGFVINGAAAYDRSGFTVSMAGDINGDGLDDVIVGADGSDPNGSESGAAYAVFGKSDGTAVELSDVAAGIGGFVINGVGAYDGAGISVSSAGDVNGDGLDDLIVGAEGDDPNGGDSGASFVVFGKSSGAAVELSDVEGGTGGFVINGASANDAAGRSVSSAGDVNGDGLDDLIVGAEGDDPNGGDSGASFVVFGKSGGTSVELSDIEAGTGGFAINGVTAYDRSGGSVSSAGDINGDGLDDVVVGAWSADPNGSYSGASFVVFGKSDGTAVELSDVNSGTGGFAINGAAAFNLAGYSVSGAGDVNGDGLDDVIVGAFAATPNGAASGTSYVVFGKSDGTAVELSDIEAGTGGFAINGVSANDQSGISVSAAGDVNGDGLDDVIVGAYRDDPNGTDSGASFVVFGKTDGTAVALSDIEAGIGGFAAHGIAMDDLAGISVGGAGDVNNDGLDDVVIGAHGDQPNGTLSGTSFVLFGKSAIDLIASSDTGSSDVDNVTGDRTPTIEFAAEAGVTVEIDWDDGNGFVAAASAGTGAAQQETLATPYAANGAKNIQVRLTNGLNETTVETLQIQIVSQATPGDDVIDLSFSTTNEEIGGLAGNDIILTGTGDDVLRGMAGDDILGGGPGADDHFGGSGNDTVTYFNAAAGLTADLIMPSKNTGDAAGDTYSQIQNLIGSEFNDFLWGTFAANSIEGLGGNDQLFGRAGDDILNGGLGDDLLNGGTGADMLIGGGGSDTASYLTASGPVIVDLETPASNTGEAAGDTFVQISNIAGTSAFNDQLFGSADNNILFGGGGADFLQGRAGDDNLIGAGDNDILDGGAGGDILNGGAGIDTADYRSATGGVTADLTDPLNNTGDAAGDTYVGIENIQGSNFDDTLTGDAVANTLLGNDGNDVLNGMDGDDTLTGLIGNDILDGGAGADMLLGGAGLNTASYGSAAAGVRADLAAAGTNTGDAAGDSYNQIQNLVGSSFDDFLGGTAAANFLEGGDGNDTLWGRGGGDTSTGGAGDDQFFYQNGFGIETITDFEALNDQETISLIQVSNITDFADLAANHLTQVGADAVITDGAGQIILQNVQVTDLDVNDFVIVGLSSIDLIDASDTGASITDDLTNDTTPTIEFITDPGVLVEVDWDDGNGFVPGGNGTGAAQQETLGTDYATDGVKNIQVRATHTASGFVFNKSLAVTIDTATTVSAVDLIDASDTGISNVDDITGDSTPTIEFTAEAGASVQIDWGDGNGFVPAAGAGTGATQQETLAAAYLTNGVKSIQVQATDLAGNTDTESLNIEIVGISPDNFIGGNGDNTFFGFGGDDEFLLRFGNDTVTGGDDADLFKFDGRYVNDGDAHTITDLDFSEGDTILFRFFDPGTFDDLADPGNPLQVTNGGQTATFDSVEDIVEAHLNGVLQVSDSGDGDTLITIPSAGDIMTVELDGLAFSSLNIPVDPSPTDDTLVGTSANDILNGYGGDDLITLRFGDDTATGGTGGDRFILDGRYINDGDAHTITDLNFGEGDRIEMRFMDVDTFDNSLDPTNQFTVQANGTKGIFTTVEDLLEMSLNGVITGADDGFGGTLLTGTVGGNMFTLTLDGIDIF
jgi:Ca2+-binding RTX toxin-like protein